MPKKGQSYKCTQEMIEKVCVLVEQKCNWKAIAKALSVSEKTLERWRNKDDEYYQDALVKAIEATLEKMSVARIKSNQHTEADRHRLKKVVRERAVIDVRTKDSRMKLPPPVMPPSHFTKKMIVKYANEFLDYIIPDGYTNDEIRMMCRKRIEELTTEVMITVKEEIQEVSANQQAVKNVLSNCGPKDERWNFKQDLTHGVDDTLAEFLKGLEE